MIAQSRYLDLITCLVASPNGGHRRAAHAVLAREMVTHKKANGRLIQLTAPSHPVYKDVPSSDLGLAALVAQSKPADEALKAAKFFLRYDREPNGLQHLTDSTPTLKTPHGLAEQNARTIGEQLRSLVIADVGQVAFDAARASYAEHFAGWATLLERNVALYNVLAHAEPGEAFALHPRWYMRPGYTVRPSGHPNARRLAVPAAGTYKVHFHGTLQSASTSPNTTVNASVDVGGTELATYSGLRESGNPLECVDVGDTREFFLEGQSLSAVIADVASTIRVRNGSSHVETIGGFLVIWRA